MDYILSPITEGDGTGRSLIFVRGKQFFRSYPQTRWYKALKEHGYQGQLFTFRWPSPGITRRTRVGHARSAGDVLWKRLSRECMPDPENCSLVGFSMGGEVVARVLELALLNGRKFRRAYLFGSTSPQTYNWTTLAAASSRGIWNFYSREDHILDLFHDDSVGLKGMRRRRSIV
jgi:hypothetical protein